MSEDALEARLSAMQQSLERIEEQVKKTNGTVRAHEIAIAVLSQKSVWIMMLVMVLVSLICAHMLGVGVV